MTDSQGRAQTVYTASNTTSANQGVQITALCRVSLQSRPSRGSDSRTPRVFVSIGTGNDIEEPTAAQYRVDYIVQVTDANGNGVAGVPVALRVLSKRYYQGCRGRGQSWWTTITQCRPAAQRRRADRDGILDPGEDFNNSGRIEAGNIASISPCRRHRCQRLRQAQVYYPQEYAYYLTSRCRRSATVSGHGVRAHQHLHARWQCGRLQRRHVAPPGPISPFGVARRLQQPELTGTSAALIKLRPPSGGRMLCGPCSANPTST